MRDIECYSMMSWSVLEELFKESYLKVLAKVKGMGFVFL
jgi:hypothetical protein